MCVISDYLTDHFGAIKHLQEQRKKTQQHNL